MITDNYVEILSSSELFGKLSKESISNIFKELDYKVEKYSKDDIIFVEDDECKCLSIILSGKVEIQKIDSNGKILTVAQFSNGDVFGELLIFSDKSRYPMTVMSKTNSVVLHMERASVIRLCQTESHFLYSYLKMISNKALILNQKLKEVTLKTIRQQVAEFIINQSKIQNSSTIKMSMSKKEWADKIGVQRPSLSRELIKMKEEGLIDYDRDLLTVLDMEALEYYV